MAGVVYTECVVPGAGQTLDKGIVIQVGIQKGLKGLEHTMVFTGRHWAG